MATYIGKNSDWSRPFMVQALILDALESAPGSLSVYKHLPIEWQLQRKDTSMLCLEGLYEYDVSNPWDSEHSSHDIHGKGYCARATLAMLASYYGSNLTQDRISFEFYKGGPPEGDLGHDRGPTEYSEVERVNEWALGLDLDMIIEKPSFEQIIKWINNDQPIYGIFPSKNEEWRHASLIIGYLHFPTLEEDIEFLRVLDPFEKERWVPYNEYDIDAYMVGPSGPDGALNARMEEDDDWDGNIIADTIEDSDSDGIVDFDEIYRFGTNHLGVDSDNDGVPDKAEIRSYIFDNDGERLSVSWGPDFDGDGIRTELDPDSDGGGAPDGCEDTNFNGKYEPELGETSNFNPTDDNLERCMDPDEMVLIPAGEFQMGCDPEHNGGYECEINALPLHAVYLDDYYIDKYEVTNSRYAECVEAGYCSLPYEGVYHHSELEIIDYFDNPTFKNYPVIVFGHEQAQEYCSWAGKRLPTEAEWEKAARGTSPITYPWGDEEPDCQLANHAYGVSGYSYLYCSGFASEIGSHGGGVSPYGIHDMAGNVSEWVNDYYSDNYYSWSPNQNPQGPTTDKAKKFSLLACPTCIQVVHVLRGGNFIDETTSLTTSSRRYPPLLVVPDAVGFRCAADVDYDTNEEKDNISISSCPGSPPQRLVVGQLGKVCTKSDAIRLRTTPGNSGKIIASLNPGTIFEVIDGPECAGSNWSWWKVRLDDGQEGWLAEGGDDIDPYFLCPIP